MNINQICRRESGLPAAFNCAQLAAIAVGAVISYGLVSGSALPLIVAGPAAVLSYVVAALTAWLMMRCLSRMTQAHPTPGAFASYAEAYLGERTGFVVRAAYVLAAIGIVGTEIALLETVFAWWLAPMPPAWVGVGLLVMLNLLHLAGAKAFASVEFLLTALKTLALIALIGLATYTAFIAAPVSPQAVQAAAAQMINTLDAPAMWEAFVVATLGFIGLETFSIAGAETKAKGPTIGRWMRRTTGFVVALVLASVAATAWFQWNVPAAMNTPAFVHLLEVARLPGARQLFAVLMLMTVVSILNCQIYGASRMLFSMARGGQAPAVLGRIRRGGIGVAATVTVVLAAAVYGLYTLSVTRVYVVVSAVATTGLAVVWVAIFLSYARFRRDGRLEERGRKHADAEVWLACMGALTMGVIVLSTLSMEAFSPTLRYGIPFLLLLWLMAEISMRLNSSKRRESTHRPRTSSDRSVAPMQTHEKF